MFAHRWPICTRALAKMIGVSNTPAFQYFCMTKVRHVHGLYPVLHTSWQNVALVSHSGRIASTICPTIVWLDQHSTPCACQLVRLLSSPDQLLSTASIYQRSILHFQIIQKWLVSVSIQIRQPATFGRASNDWLVIPRIFRWVRPGANGNKANDQSRFHCHRNHKFRSHANFPMWPVSPPTIHSDILACKPLSGIRLILGNHEPTVSCKSFDLFIHGTNASFNLFFRWPVGYIQSRITTIFVNRN